jgi:hypothetical protein
VTCPTGGDLLSGFSGPSSEAFRHHEEKRDDKYPEKGCSNHAAEHRRAHGMARRGAGTFRDNQRKDSKDKRKACHHYRAETLLRQIGDADWDRPITRIAQTSKDFAEFTIDYPYGDVLSRPGLELRTRQICTVSSLLANGHCNRSFVST